MKDVVLHKSWKERLHGEFSKQYFLQLRSFVHTEYTQRKIFPSPKNIFRALDLCPFEKVKVVILGQDPYHGDGQANGLCFAVNEGVTLPPSLKNIFKEIEQDLGHAVEHNGSLERWAQQGVLLLNATLTVRAHEAGSHQGKGWEEFTDEIIRKLSDERENIVFMLWGNYAKNKGKDIDWSKHLVLEAAHPSPFSAHNGFFGCKHFSQANKYLKKHNISPIKW